MPIRKLTWAVLAIAACAPTVVRGGGQGNADRPSARALIDNLHAGNVDVRRKAAADIRTTDRSVQRELLPVMIEALAKEKDGQVRLAVLDALTVMGPDAAAAVPALLQTLRTDFGGGGSEAANQDYRSAPGAGSDWQTGGRRAVRAAERAQAGRASRGGHGPWSNRAGRRGGRAGPDRATQRQERTCSERSPGGTRAHRDSGGRAARRGIPRRRSARSRRRGRRPGAPARSERRGEASSVQVARDTSTAVRAAAMKSLGRIRLPDAALIDIVQENVGHDNDEVRVAVVNLLVERRSLLARIAPGLESLLTAKNDRVSRHAAYLLARTGPDAAPRLLAALPNEGSRIDQIAEALAQIGRPVAPTLMKAVRSPDAARATGAALALGQVRPPAPGTVSALTAGLDDPDSAVKSAFLSGIGYLGSRAYQAVPSVRARLLDKSSEIRLKAIQILAQSAPRDERLVTDMIAVLDDSDAKVQREAIDVLRALGPPGRRALGAVIGKLSSKDPDVRFAAAEMVGSHGPAAAAAVPALGNLLDDPAPKLRMIAAQTLGTMGKEAQPALARLSMLLGAEQVEVREAATATLASLELDPGVVRPHLARALGDSRSEVRRAAMKGIQRMGPQGAIFVPDIILMAQNKENLRQVERALRRFERAGPDVRSVPELVKQLGHKQDSVRLLAIKFLKLAGQNAKDALPALERMRDDPSAEVRKQAEAASEQIKKKSTAGQPGRTVRNVRLTNVPVLA